LDSGISPIGLREVKMGACTLWLISEREKGNFMKLGHSLKRFLGDESGQSTTEYILILSVVVMVAMKFKNSFGKILMDLVAKVGSDVQSAASQDP
jgi:Flp pilus assembly pilin Flp